VATVTWQGDDLTNPTYWNDADNWDTGTVPANGDDVVLSNAANCNVNANTANLKSFDMTGYTGTLSGSSAINVIGAASTTVSVKFAGTISWTGTLNLNPTAADTNIQCTFNGKTIQAITINGNTAGDVYYIDAVTVTAITTLTNGILHTDGAGDNSGLTHTWGSFTTATGTKTLNLGNSTITLTTGGSTAWVWSATNATLTEGTSTLILSGASAQATLGGETYYTMSFTGSGTAICGNSTASSGTFTNLYRIGTAVKGDLFALYGNANAFTVTGEFKVQGNSAVNRVLVYAATLGTAKALTITGATISNCQNVDFRDITFTSTGAMDFTNGGANWIGDCGGNTSAGGGTATFTTADDWYWNGSGTRNFSDYTYWYTATNGGGTQMASTRCPLPQDTCYINGDSIDGATTIDQDLPRIPAIDFTGVAAMNFDMDNISQAIYGNFKVADNVAVTDSGTKSIIFEGRGSHVFNPSNEAYGTTVPFYFRSIGGSYTLTSDFGSGIIQLDNGTFDADTYNLSIYSWDSSNSNARTLLMGSGTWTFSKTTSVWAMGTVTNLTSTSVGETSTIVLNDGTSFAGGGLTYNNITLETYTSDITFTGSNTFATFTITAPRTVKFMAGTTTTVSSFVATGGSYNSGKFITIASDTVKSKAYIISKTEQISGCSFTDIYVRSNTAWYGVENCLDLGRNSGIRFVRPKTKLHKTIIRKTTTSQSVIVQPGVLTARISLQSPIVVVTTGVTSVTISADVIANRVISQAPGVIISASVSVNTIQTFIKINSPSVAISASISTNVQNAQLKIQSADIRISYAQSLNVISARLAPQSPTIYITGNVILQLNEILVRLLMNDPTIVASGVLSGVADIITKLSQMEKEVARPSRMSKTIYKSSRISKIIEDNSPLH
jgi:hypothetical protein